MPLRLIGRAALTTLLELLLLRQAFVQLPQIGLRQCFGFNKILNLLVNELCPSVLLLKLADQKSFELFSLLEFQKASLAFFGEPCLLRNVWLWWNPGV